MNAPPSPARPSGPQRVVIDPRRWVSIRPIERSDEPGLTSFYAQLSPESRRRRFLGFGSPAPAALAAIFTDRSSPGVVGILGEPGPLDGAVVAHASVQPDGIGGAEVAFTVADALQGHGIGRALVAAALGMARSMGLARASASMLADNVAMRYLLRPPGCVVLSDLMDAGVEEVTLQLVS